MKNIKIKTDLSSREIAKLLVEHKKVYVTGIGIITLKEREAYVAKSIDGIVKRTKVKTMRLSITRSQGLKNEVQKLLKLDKENK